MTFMLKYVKYIKKGKTLSIHKIEKLTSIGKFRNYLATGTVNFEKLTLIYGNNGSGKTTLTSIFRSLGVCRINQPILSNIHP